MKNTKEKKRLGTLDIFIILALVAVIACVVIRYVLIDSSDVSDKVELDEYVVSFRVEGIKDSSANKYMMPGSKFYIKDTNVYFGELLEGLTISDAEEYYEMQNGEIVIAENNAVGDLYRVDVEAKLLAKGKADANGRFLLGGNTYIGVNKKFTLYSKYLLINVLITDISKAK